MARIGLVDVDGHNYPNYALMKISAYHKSIGDSVEWANPLFGHYDKVYESKIFTFTPPQSDIFDCEVVRGGTGYDIQKKLPEEIENIGWLDYSIYPQVDRNTAYGFITRGCPNKCPWCVVPMKEGQVKPYRTVDEITENGKRSNIVLMDNNILASEFGIQQLEEIADRGYRIDLNQGNSARLVDERIAKLFARIKWINGSIRFAADTKKQIAEVERAMALIDGYRGKPAHYLIYTMIDGTIEQAYERISYFKKYPRVRINAQPYRNFSNPRQVIPQWQKDMARWSMRRELYGVCDFKDFSPRKGFVCSEYFKKD
jgi:hypothetical protein